MSFANKIGDDDFTWWIGVIEDRKDPLNLGRAKVRIFGAHVDNKQMIPTDSLPWAQIVNAPSMEVGIKEGYWAFGFFMDGQSKQVPCILGVFHGIPQEFTNSTKGFSDPRSDAELSSAPKKPVYSGTTIIEGSAQRFPSSIGEPTTSRLYRNENIDKTIVAFKKAAVVNNINSADGSQWSEPVTKYATIPPYNNVLETESGHILEFDDTPGSERVSISHRKGSFEEYHPDASKVTKIVGTNYELYLKGSNMYVSGALNITVIGNTNILSTGKTVIKASNLEVDCDINVNGSVTTSGSVTASGEVTGNGVKLSTHKHAGVQSGGSQTSTPV